MEEAILKIFAQSITRYFATVTGGEAVLGTPYLSDNDSESIAYEFSAIIVVVPLIVPVAEKYGIDPVHLGIIFLTNLEMSYSIPPVGLNLFIASLRFGRPVLDLYRASVPFLGIYLIVLLLVTYFPQLSLWLVNALNVR